MNSSNINQQRLRKTKSLNNSNDVYNNNKKKWRPPGYYEIPNIFGTNCFLQPTDHVYEYHLRKYNPSKNISKKPWLPAGLCKDISKLPPLLKRSSSESTCHSFITSFQHQLNSILPKNITISSVDPRNKYHDFEEIGIGVNGPVLRVTHRLKSYKLAIKRCHIENDSEYKQAMVNELKIMSMGHKNLIRLREITLWKQILWIGLDLQLCSVFAILCQRAIPEPYTIYIFQEVLKGLVFLHAKGYIHRDIKSENILVGYHGEIKLTDFGLSTTIWVKHSHHKQQLNHDRLGTCKWMAPEVIREQNYTEKIDIWSLGITLIELMDRVPPHFLLKNDLDLFTAILNHPNPTFTYSYPTTYLRCFASWLLDVNATTRPGANEVAEELLSHIQSNLLKCSSPLEFIRFVNRTISAV
ncbi:unnamed protein product [Cunninghamella echinulata]